MSMFTARVALSGDLCEVIMIQWLYRRLEPFIQTVITERILLFHAAMIRRGQIQPIEPGRCRPKTN